MNTWLTSELVQISHFAARRAGFSAQSSGEFAKESGKLGGRAGELGEEMEGFEVELFCFGFAFGGGEEGEGGSFVVGLVGACLFSHLLE